MHEALLSDVGPNFGHITQKFVLNLLLPIFLLEVLSIESFWNVVLIGLLLIFLVCASFPNASYDLCNGVHRSVSYTHLTLPTTPYV